MENEEMVYSFMEISNLPIEDARRFLQQSGFHLERALQIYYDSQASQSSTSSSQPTNEIEGAVLPEQEEEEEVRQPIPRQYDIMVTDDVRHVRLSRVQHQEFSSFRNFKREMEIQEELASGGAHAAKRKCLEDLYRHPAYITNVDLSYAKLQGQRYGKWIALLVNDESLESLSLNRDIFNEASQKAKNIITKNFIMLRKNCNDHEGLRIRQIYNLLDSAVPIFLVIDSLTGELKKNFGDCTKLTLQSVVRELKKYTASADKQLVYNANYEDSDDESDFAFSHLLSDATALAGARTSTQSQASSTPIQTVTSKTATVESDEESFASLSSDEDDDNDDEDKGKREMKEEEEVDEIENEPKVLDSDDEELLKSDDGPQTNVMLRLQDENHKFRYPSTRTVAHLINYIYRNYLIQTGVYDNKTKRFSLFSKIHNKCLTMLDQEKTLQETDIHPSIVLLHNTLDKDE